MKDQLLRGFVDDFKTKFEIENETDSVAFENFVNYSVLTKFHCDSFELDQIRVGGTNDGGLDGISVIVNDHVVSQIDEIEYFQKNSKRLEVQFIFCQAKTSPKFEAKEIQNFLFGVEQFFSEVPALPFNEDVLHQRRIKDHLYEKCGINFRENPSCHIYYATSGEWLGDDNQLAPITTVKKRLASLNIFNSVDFHPIDAKKLRQIYRELQNKVETSVQFERKATLPTIDRVSEAYIGTMRCNEFLKLIVDENGEIRRRLFYDNVRDFQGKNSVNSEIAETLKKPDKQDKFVLLNNGVTVVAKDLKPTGDVFRIIDYQIVNGCQTSHIIHASRNELRDTVFSLSS